MARRARNGPSRRKIIGIAALVPAALKAHASADAETLPTLCSKWLAQDAKVEHLSLRWGQLEVRAIREFGWRQLSPEARRGLPLQAEMDQICAQLLVLDDAQAADLAALRATKATDLPGAVAKLVVAARLFRDEDEDLHQFVVEAIADLASLEIVGLLLDARSTPPAA